MPDAPDGQDWLGPSTLRSAVRAAFCNLWAELGALPAQPVPAIRTRARFRISHKHTLQGPNGHHLAGCGVKWKHWLCAVTLAVISENGWDAAVLKEMTMKALLSPLIGRLLVLLRSVGPYAAIELLLPGGSIVALLYWCYRHRARVHGVSFPNAVEQKNK